MLCKDDGSYDFVNIRENWPTCQADINCDPKPPVIPTSVEYVNKKVKNFALVKFRKTSVRK